MADKNGLKRSCNSSKTTTTTTKNVCLENYFKILGIILKSFLLKELFEKSYSNQMCSRYQGLSDIEIQEKQIFTAVYIYSPRPIVWEPQL